jgi:hypothetical protein
VLVNIAYLDNFEHVEPLLEQLNATALKEEIEEMMRVELAGLIENSADGESIDAKIAEIDAKLDEAIVIVPEFTLAAVFVLASAIGAFILMSRTNRFARNS